MNNKKQGLVILALFFVIAIGIGYATASSQNVDITGTASAIAGDFDIQFDQSATVSTAKDGSDTVVVEGAYTSSEVATMTVSGLKAVGDYAEATYTIKNASNDVNADVTAEVTTQINDTTHYQVTVIGGGNNIAPNGTTTVTVRVSLIKAFSDSDAAGVAKTFTVRATGTAVE